MLFRSPLCSRLSVSFEFGKAVFHSGVPPKLQINKHNLIACLYFQQITAELKKETQLQK